MSGDIENIICAVADEDRQHSLKGFMNTVANSIAKAPALVKSNVVHSHKMRLKNLEHLREKITRKSKESDPITVDNVFHRVTDLAGVRILHLFQEQFTHIHQVIIKKVEEGEWHFVEQPKVFTWDPEAKEFFSKFDLGIEEKQSFYTSVHYLLKPRADSDICCEVQVRTLFEEIWGEVDHQLNYPRASDSEACKEQLKVLSKIVGAGSRLLDSIHRLNSTTPAP